MNARLAELQARRAELRQRRRELNAALERVAQEYREGTLTAAQRVIVQREIMREVREITRETSVITIVSARSRIEQGEKRSSAMPPMTSALDEPQ